jgi:hypothetical protein
MSHFTIPVSAAPPKIRFDETERGAIGYGNGSSSDRSEGAEKCRRRPLALYRCGYRDARHIVGRIRARYCAS